MGPDQICLGLAAFIRLPSGCSWKSQPNQQRRQRLWDSKLSLISSTLLPSSTLHHHPPPPLSTVVFSTIQLPHLELPQRLYRFLLASQTALTPNPNHSPNQHIRRLSSRQGMSRLFKPYPTTHNTAHRFCTASSDI